MNNLHRIMGAKFMHEKVGLCEHCALRREYGEWQGFCTAKQKILSAGKEGKKHRCKDFQQK